MTETRQLFRFSEEELLSQSKFTPSDRSALGANKRDRDKTALQIFGRRASLSEQVNSFRPLCIGC
eukprot:4805148-Amphidinium_carterae.1